MSIEISVILPMYNEEKVVEKIIHELSQQLDQTELSYEIICVNDGSSDSTPILLDSLSQDDVKIVPIHFSRNFGKEGAIAAGLDLAKGNVIVLLDADMQHPPGLIPQMLDLWNQGFDIVEARKVDRGKECWYYRLFAKIFYKIISQSTGKNIEGATDFKLLDRNVVDVLNSLPEKVRFFRGLVSWVGFNSAVVDFEVQERIAGESGWSFRKLLRYALRNILAYTPFPLYATAGVGLITISIGVFLGIQTLYNYFLGNAVSGFTTVILLQIIFSGIVMTGIGTVAVYLAMLMGEIKGRPIYIINPAKKRQ